MDDDQQSVVRYGRIPQRQPRRYKTVKRAFGRRVGMRFGRSLILVSVSLSLSSSPLPSSSPSSPPHPHPHLHAHVHPHPRSSLHLSWRSPQLLPNFALILFLSALHHARSHHPPRLHLTFRPECRSPTLPRQPSSRLSSASQVARKVPEEGG